jgi:hypothetical protein
MRKFLLFTILLMFSSLLIAQQALNNDAIIKLVKAGLTEDLIITTINASPGTFDTSVDGLIALKTAGVTDKVVAAIVTKANTPAVTAPVPVSPPMPPTTESNGNAEAQTAAPVQRKPLQPRVYLTSASKGNNRNSERDQSMEMSKDFERDCTGIKISINQQTADYTVVLNHIEVGLIVRDNQFQIANKDGDLIAKTKEGGSIAGGVKKACEIILEDWAKR